MHPASRLCRAARKVRSVIRAERVQLEGRELAINASPSGGCFLEVLAALDSQMQAMLSHHVKMLVVRLDIRLYDYTPDNAPMTNFCRKMKKRVGRRYETARIGYLWVRELESAPQQHYHLVLMLDAHKVLYPAKVIKLVEDIAERWGWPKPYTPRNCYYIVHRNDPESYQEAFCRASYLAKERSKGHKAVTANNYGHSNIPKRQPGAVGVPA